MIADDAEDDGADEKTGGDDDDGYSEDAHEVFPQVCASPVEDAPLPHDGRGSEEGFRIEKSARSFRVTQVERVGRHEEAG